MLKLSEGMNISRKAILITSAVILLIVVGTTGYFYWVNSKKSGAQSTLENSGNIAEDISNSATKGVLPSIQTNPLENKPDVNPANKANPYQNIKTNPF